jgi:NAD(P)-dependent dehydrogenase (short-subunit alcohol dehydrogenase family)
VESATTTKDVANAILFLAGDESKSISGIALPIDRAWSTM